MQIWISIYFVFCLKQNLINLRTSIKYYIEYKRIQIYMLKMFLLTANLNRTLYLKNVLPKFNKTLSNSLHDSFFFIFSYSYMARKILFLSLIFEIEFMIELHNWSLLNPKVKFLVLGLCVCVWVCCQNNSKRNKNMKFESCILNILHTEMLLEALCRNRSDSLYS